MKTIGVIPARYKSSRYPGKPLVSILGKPMIIHVAEKLAAAIGKENTYIATEDNRIVDCVKQHGYNAILTADTHLTGTDRVWEVSQKIEADIYLNVQGDEPMLNPADIIKVADARKQYPQYITNGMTRLGVNEDVYSVNIPKVLTDLDNNLIYMSRLAIPGIKSPGNASPDYWKQVCIYAFTAQELDAFGRYGKKTPAESFEDIEILRFVEMGYKIKMVETSQNSLAVDVPDDVAKVEAAMGAL